MMVFLILRLVVSCSSVFVLFSIICIRCSLSLMSSCAVSWWVFSMLICCTIVGCDGVLLVGFVGL